MKVKEIGYTLRKEFPSDISIQLFNEDEEVNYLLTDSRNYFKPEGTLFFAIKTSGGNDGHFYLEELYNRGIKNFVVEYVPEAMQRVKDINLFIVPDSKKALMEVGRQHRSYASEVVAITGSRGKTELKEILYNVLEPDFKISRSPRSWNSKIGVPLSLWQIEEGSDISIIEAGISQKGEMSNLAKSIDPNVVIFTNIGDAHSQGFASMLDKAKEKALLAKGNNVNAIIYPKDSILLDEAISNFSNGKKVISWSLNNKNADLYIEIKKKGPGEDTVLEYIWQKRKYQFKVELKEEFDIDNISSALAYYLYKGLDHKNIESRLSHISKISTRLNVAEGVNNCSIIIDSFTCDFSSLLPAIDFMLRRKMPSQTKTLILGDLKNMDEEEVKKIATLVKETGINKFIGIGEKLTSFSFLFPKNSFFFKNTDDFLKNLSLSDFHNEILLVKGDQDLGFKRIGRILEAKKHETVLEVNLDSIIRNYNYFRSKVPLSTGIIAMVKAWGYGAGSYEIAKTLQDAGASYLAVAVLDEALDLRKNGITMPIMIMNPKASDYRLLFQHRLEPVIYSFSMLETLINEAKRNSFDDYPVHLKLDTGMHRMGFEKHEISLLTNILKKEHNIKVKTIFSHLATADCLDMDEFTKRQLRLFDSISKEIIEGLNYNIKRHILNSAGILRFPEYHYDFVRLGIGLYGANTLPKNLEKPLSVVSTLRTVVICIREVKQGEAVGYGRKGLAKENKRIATIPVGYADGLNRRLGNGNISVFINNHRVPTIGNICMDATMIDVTGIECSEGDEVEIFGENVPLQDLADILDTIPYEILTSVSPRVKRVYYRE